MLKLFYVQRVVGQKRLIIFIIISTCFFWVGESQAKAVSYSCKRQQINRLQFGKSLYVRVIKYGFSDFKKLKKVAVIVPPTGGTNLIDRQYAYYFCRQGLPTIIMDEWTGSDAKFDPYDLTSHQQELDWGKKAFLSLTRYLSPAKVSVLSTSKGGIGTSCFLSEFPKNIRSLVTVVAGAPLHLTISRSNQEDLKNLREMRMRRWNIKAIEDYDRMIYDSLKVKTSRRNPNVRLAMIIAEEDFSVPSGLQNHLAKLWRPEKIWRLGNNHFLTIIFSFGRLRDRIHNFMEESF